MCKCVALQLIESVPRGTDDCDIDVHQLPSALWKPRAPTGNAPELVRASPDTSEEATSRPSPVRLYVDFGGESGEKLPFINRLVGLFDGYSGLLKGFGFIYDDGTSSFYGDQPSVRDMSSSRPCVEMPFALCGKLGERLVEIRVSRVLLYQSWYIHRLEV